MTFAPNRPSGPGGRGRHRRGRRGGPRQGKQQQGKNPQHGGIYTAPMDHSYRAALHGSHQGKRRGGGMGTQYLQPDPEPLPVQHESLPARIFAFVSDLFFVAKIQEISRKLNVKVEFVKPADEIFEKQQQNGNGDEKPALIIVDLNNAAIKPLSTIQKLKAKLKKATNIIGFVSHVQGELKVKAQEAGCDTVLPRSAFSSNLPQLLRRHGAPEEAEAGA